MRVLLSTIGSRGDVQPLLALASELRALGEEVSVCAPPDFRELALGLDLPFVPLGPEVRGTAKPSPVPRALPTPEQIRRMMHGTVATQFQTLPAAAKGCDVLVGAGALQLALRSVAEQLAVPYVYTSYCPLTLPSPHHAPPRVPAWTPKDPAAEPRALWAEDAERWNENWRSALNSHREALGLSPVDDVRSHIFTESPWLAADPTLAPWPKAEDFPVFQTGAWILPDQRPLSPELEAFLGAGEAPVYFGFGSIRAPNDLAKSMIESARAVGRRVILSRGWAELSLLDAEPDCISVGEVNQQALFKRVAAVVHHGGAGTTTAAARAGAPQVVVPQHYDQPYFARRVEELGLGSAHPDAAPTAASLSAALSTALAPGISASAKRLASDMVADGARTAAKRIIAIDSL